MRNKLPPFSRPEPPSDVLKNPAKLAKWNDYWDVEEDRWNQERIEEQQRDSSGPRKGRK